MIDIKQLQEELEKRMVANLGMSLDHEEKGYSLEQLYEFAGKEDRVITISFRDGSESEKYFGQTITCKLLYRERERINLLQSINAGGCNYGKVRAEYLLYDKTKEQVDKLVSEGFDSKDVVEILVAPLMQPDNIYGAECPRQFKTIEIPLEPEPPLEELKFEFGGLCHFMQDGMLLTPAEQRMPGDRSVASEINNRGISGTGTLIRKKYDAKMKVIDAKLLDKVSAEAKE